MDGYFKALNPAWNELLGYQDDELLRRPYIDFVHPDDRAATIAEASKLAHGIGVVHFRNRYRCKDGGYKSLAWTATPIMGDGTIYAGARDVTDEVRAADT
jgi:PAS domain S-box-containing protein